LRTACRFFEIWCDEETRQEGKPTQLWYLEIWRSFASYAEFSFHTRDNHTPLARSLLSPSPQDRHLHAFAFGGYPPVSGSEFLTARERLAYRLQNISLAVRHEGGAEA
jgi:hypothetical protein